MTVPLSKHLEAEFLNTALRRSEWIALRDMKKANEEFDRLHKLKDQLRQLPDRGADILRRLSGSDDLNVCIAAAVALLAVDEDFATRVLQGIAQSETGIPSFSAEKSLEEWKKGNMREYWK